MIYRWHEGPVVHGAFPILVDFSSFEDKAMVWKSWRDGFQSPNVFVTKDSRSRREKARLSMTRKKRKKSDYHSRCFLACSDIYVGDGDTLEKCKDHQEDDFDK